MSLSPRKFSFCTCSVSLCQSSDCVWSGDSGLVPISLCLLSVVLYTVDSCSLCVCQMYICVYCRSLYLCLSSVPVLSLSVLKRQCHETFSFWFFYESVSPKPHSNPFGPFQIFLKIRGDIRKSTTLAANLPPESKTPAANFATCFASVVDTGGK
jgi:hypothetical protein